MQATTIQLCVLVTVLEQVVQRIVGGDVGKDPEVPGRFLEGLQSLHQSLLSPPLLERLGALVQEEVAAYRGGCRANYRADHLAIDVLTDTTERSPTFCTPPFRKHGDQEASESMAFLFVPGRQTPAAWAWLLQRQPRCLQWNTSDLQGLLPDSKMERTGRILREITETELMRFAIGADGMGERPLREGDLSLTILCDADDAVALGTEVHDAGGASASCASRATLRFTTRPASGGQGSGETARVVVPEAGLLLDGLTRVAVKMVLNAISTCVMVRLGRVMGNTMIYVVPSNLKLIDRATRYIVRLTGLDYDHANRCLFEAIEYVEPRMLAGQAYPPVVGLTVLRVRDGISLAEAERRLGSEACF